MEISPASFHAGQWSSASASQPLSQAMKHQTAEGWSYTCASFDDQVKEDNFKISACKAKEVQDWVPGLEPEPQGYAFPAQRRHHWAGDGRAAGRRIEGTHRG